ncbi:MAG: DUF2914 domain-containing protein [Candidatus Paceibacterota bacterium]
MTFLKRTRHWYGRFERPISSLSLIFGFIFDALTLKRLDTVWENSWILAHIIIVGVFILLIHIKEHGEGDELDPNKSHFWYVNILQFFFGGLLSTFLVFYFRSTDIFSTWPFLFLLALAFIANESFKRHYTKLSFQISLFFLSIYSFMIFLIPIVLHKISDWVFLLSGVVSLILITIFVVVLFYLKKDKKTLNKKLTLYLTIGIFSLINFLYFTNLIPPIPLSLKDGGIYHLIEKNKNGNYNIAFESHGWKDYFNLYKDFSIMPGATVYAYSAVFSPKDLNLTIIHEWQYYNTASKKWVTGAVVSLPVTGGRDGGFRTYSKRVNIAPGKWRVNVETEQGKTIGRLLFNIVSAYTEPPLLNSTK